MSQGDEVATVNEDEYVRFVEDPPMAEEVQELGREGVAIIKRWIEATTHIQLPYDVYDFTPNCIAPHFGGRKRFDLAGRYMSGDKNRVFVECKRYRTVGGQAAEFTEFLRIAYSATLSEINHYGRDLGTRYIWATYHPFSQSKWANLESHDNIREALNEKPDYLGGSAVDEDRVRSVAERVMVLVFNPKQEGLSLTEEELLKIRPHLERS